MVTTRLIETAPGNIRIQTVGLRDLSKALTQSKNKLAAKEFSAQMKAAGEPLADLARRYAASIADEGDFAASIKISGGRSGIFLQSTDPGAGTIEFARQGAVSGSGRPVGVPMGSPPRALFAAINEGLGDVAERIESAVDDLLSRYLAREFTTPDGKQ